MVPCRLLSFTNFWRYYFINSESNCKEISWRRLAALGINSGMVPVIGALFWDKTTFFIRPIWRKTGIQETDMKFMKVNLKIKFASFCYVKHVISVASHSKIVPGREVTKHNAFRLQREVPLSSLTLVREGFFANYCQLYCRSHDCGDIFFGRSLPINTD